jgi:Flp pilus assembly protein TadG
MIRKLTFTRRVADDKRGVALLEFALCFPVVLILILGILELGYQAYMQSMANGVVQRAARAATVGTVTPTQIDEFVRDQMTPILQGQDKNTAVVINKLNYRNFSNVGGGEKITGDTAPVGSYNSTDCYEDRNGNSRFDATGGGASGVGSADDIVYYEVVVTVPRLIPVVTYLIRNFYPNTTSATWADNTVVSAKTIVRNQPYSDQTAALIRCTSI